MEAKSLNQRKWTTIVAAMVVLAALMSVEALAAPNVPTTLN